MRKIMRLGVMALLFCLISVVLAGCGEQLKNYRSITNVDDLEGRKIGVIMGWSSDYLLTPRDGKDLILYRYDENADLLMALCYRHLDAVAVDKLTWEVMNNVNSGLSHVEEPITMDGYLAYMSRDREDLRDEFNDFIAEFKQTEEYADLCTRIEKFDGTNYEWDEKLELKGNGEKIKACYDATVYPFSFISSEGQSQGFDVELMYYFANALNLDLELVPTGETDLYSGIETGRYDMAFGMLSIAFEPEAISVGIPTSDVYYELPLYLVEVADPDTVVIGE